MPQLLSANGRRSGGRHIESAVSAAASGANANKRGSAGLVFANIEFRPMSLLHFFASSSLIARPASTACYGCESLHLLARSRDCGGTATRVDSAPVGNFWSVVMQYFALYQALCSISRRLLVPYIPLAPAPRPPTSRRLLLAEAALTFREAPGPSLRLRRGSLRSTAGGQPTPIAHSTPPPRGARFRSDGMHAVKSKHGAARS